VPEYYEFGLTAKPADNDTRISCLADSGAFVAYSGKCTGYIHFNLVECQRLNLLLMMLSDRKSLDGDK